MLTCHIPGYLVQLPRLGIRISHCRSYGPYGLVKFCEAIWSAVPAFAEVQDQPRIGPRREVIEVGADHKERRYAANLSEFIIGPVLCQDVAPGGLNVAQERLYNGALVAQISREPLKVNVC